MKKLAVSAAVALLALALVTGCDKSNEATEAAQQRVAELDKATEQANEEKVQAEARAKAEAEAENEDSDSQWVKSSDYGVRFRVPADWKVVDAEGGVSATSPDGTTTAVLVGTESESMLESAINELKSKIELKDMKFEKGGLTTINGMPGTRGSGSAVLVEPDGDQEIQFIAYVLRAGQHNITLMIFSQAEMYEAQKDIIDGIAQTLVKS